MRKEIIFVLFLLLIPFIASECTDSDNGMDYYKKGTTSGINDAMLGGFIEVTDYCVGNVLYEYYCMDLSSVNTTYNSVVAKIDFTCPDICEGGSCTTRQVDKMQSSSTTKSSGGSGSSTESSSTKSDEEEKSVPLSGNVINLDNKIDENQKQQTISLNKKTEKSSSSNSLLLISLSMVFLFSVIMLFLGVIYLRKKKRLK